MSTLDTPESRTRRAQERLRDSLREEREEREELRRKPLTAEVQKLTEGYDSLLERFAFLEARH